MYKHKVVQGLADLVAKYGGGGKDPLMRAVWFGIKGQVPSLLQSLDDNEEAIAEIEKKLMEVLDIKPEGQKEITIEIVPQQVTEQPEKPEEVTIGQAEAPEEEEGEGEGKKKRGKTKEPEPGE